MNDSIAVALDDLKRLLDEHAVGCSLPEHCNSDGGYRSGDETVPAENTVLIHETANVQGNFRFLMTGRRNKILIGPKATLATGAIEIRGSDSVVVIGERVLLRDSRIATTSSARVALGANLSCVGGNILAEGNAGAILCGNDCMFARGISIRTDDGHGVFDRSSQRRINNTSPVIIHEHVWLGSGVRVNKGAIIEAGVIVAQVSIASGRLKARAVYGGAPARLIREDVAWSRTGEWKDIPDLYR
jgi:hypothetical protein